MLRVLFKKMVEHPHANHMTYAQHARLSLTLSGMFVKAGALAAIHALFPFCYETSSSDVLIEAKSVINKSKNKKVY